MGIAGSTVVPRRAIFAIPGTGQVGEGGATRASSQEWSQALHRRGWNERTVANDVGVGRPIIQWIGQHLAGGHFKNLITPAYLTLVPSAKYANDPWL